MAARAFAIANSRSPNVVPESAVRGATSWIDGLTSSPSSLDNGECFVRVEFIAMTTDDSN